MALPLINSLTNDILSYWPKLKAFAEKEYNLYQTIKFKTSPIKSISRQPAVSPFPFFSPLLQLNSILKSQLFEICKTFQKEQVLNLLFGKKLASKFKLVSCFCLSTCITASNAPRRQLLVMRDSARVQDKTSESCA